MKQVKLIGKLNNTISFEKITTLIGLGYRTVTFGAFSVVNQPCSEWHVREMT